MSSRTKREVADDDRTVEEEPLAPEAAEPRYDVTLDYTGEFATGTVDHDDRGQARWKWNTESTPPSSDIESTFDLLKALNNDALSIEGSPDSRPSKPPRRSGYNPYDVGGGENDPKKKPRK